MAKPAKRGRSHPLVQARSPSHPPSPSAAQIVRQRLQQACYGIGAGAFVAIPAALLGEHRPSDRAVSIMIGVAAFASAMGMLLEVIGTRATTGGIDEH